jgi:glucose/mannose-6-phosphate isomerase
MGGSAIGGDYIAALAGKVPLQVLTHRGGPLPAWANDRCTVLLASYSGTTAETLATAREVEERGLPFQVLTTGGELARWASERGVEPWPLEPGRMPRAALGDAVATAAGALAARGWLDLPQGSVEAALRLLEANGAPLADKPRTGHPLAELLAMTDDRLLMVYGTGRFEAVARRWANQVNENAKLPAHWGVLPEMNHNEVVAWREGSRWADRAAVVLLADPLLEPEVARRIPLTASLADEMGWPVTVLHPTDERDLPALLELTQLGDWLSFWMALREGVDPTPIPTIEKLKAALAE